MKTIDPPSSFSATQATTPEDSSPTSMLRALDVSIDTLSNTDTLRVLEVRRPTRVAESEDERDSYGVHVEEFRAQPERPPLALVPSKPRILPPPGAVPAAQPAATAAPKPAAPPVATKPAPAPASAFTAELDKLTRKEYAPHLVDLSSTTGVRHLRIELKKKRKR